MYGCDLYICVPPSAKMYGVELHCSKYTYLPTFLYLSVNIGPSSRSRYLRQCEHRGLFMAVSGVLAWMESPSFSYRKIKSLGDIP